MCGRFNLFSPREQLIRVFGVDIPDDYTPRYNIAPTTKTLVITQETPHKAEMMTWGLIPKGSKHHKPLINARAETLAEKTSFKNSFANKRCAVLADGFYEWKQGTPYHVRSNQGPFAMAGIYTEHDLEQSFAIITTKPNKLTSHVHDRMPAMLTPSDLKEWLRTQSHKLLQPWPTNNTVISPANKQLGNTHNEGPELLNPDKKQQTLF